MAMKTNKDHKTIHEDFPLEIWDEINETKNSLNMTWYEFLPYASKCAKRNCNTSEIEDAVKEKRM